MAERLAEGDPELLGGHGRQRAAPLQTVGTVGGALDHLLELLVVEPEHVGVLAGGLAEGGPQSLEQRVTAALGDPFGVSLRELGHRSSSSSSSRVLTAARKSVAWRPNAIRWSQTSVSVIP